MDLFLYTVIALLIVQITTGDIVEGPRDAVYRNNVDANATLTCRVETSDNSNNVLIYWSINGSVVYNTLLPAPTASPKYYYSNNGGEFYMTIFNLKREDNADYGCQYGYNPRVFTARLIVADPPGDATITSTGNLVENEPAKFTCSSSGGYPAPTFVWTKDSEIIPNPKITGVDGGESTSEITVQLTKADNNKELRCEVKNELEEVKNTTLQLDVEFKPSISLRVTGRESAVVERGKGFTLTSNVESNPNWTNIEWKKGSQTLANSNLLTLDQPDGIKEDTEYTCIVTNSLGNTSSSLNVAVNYAPNVTIQEGNEVTVNEGDSLTLTCMAEAVPPQINFRWTKDNDVSTIITVSNRIDMRFVTKDQAGTYTCTASNELLGSKIGFGNASIEVHVYYAPNKPLVTISPASPSGLHKAGSTATFSCSGGEGNPAASYLWFRNGIDINHNGSVLVIDVTTYNDTGLYECAASNAIGTTRSKPLYAAFEDVPEFISSSPSEMNMTKGNTSSFLRCEYRGLPEPIIEWFYEGTPIQQLDRYIVEHTIQPDASAVYKTVVSILKFQGVDRDHVNEEDTGVYSCRAYSTVGESQRQQNFTVTVLFGPEFQGFGKVAADLGSEAIIDCEVLGNPAASSIALLKNGQEINTNNFWTVSDIELIDHIKYYKQKRTITFHDVKQTDYTTFTCKATSSLAEEEQQLILQPPGQPDSPTGLQLVDKSWDSLSIKWIPGFDGGRPQSFIITANGITAETRNTSIVLKELLPETDYSVEVTGKNEFGHSESMATIDVHTDFLAIPTPVVTYNKEDNSLTVALNSTDFCAVILAKDDGDSIELFNGECHVVTRERKFQLTAPFHNYYMAKACVMGRSNVCSEPTSTGKVTVKDEMIYIIIGVVGGILLLILIAAIVSYIIVRQHRSKKALRKASSPVVDTGHINQVMEADETDIEPAYATYAPPNNNLNATTSFSPPRSPSSNNTVQEDFDNLDCVYASVQKKPKANVKYVNMFNEQQPYIPPPPVDDGFDLPMQRMDSPPNDSNSDNTEQDTLDQLPVFDKDSYLSLITGGESQPYSRLSNTSESGYSTPDSRVKKVIYEVIV
ncbi:B-cell receptor CD22-like [Watersipora subatra]|uniref:B-cell receptor CD22-like n=1 Tax=Watersipora subatra TaxID=2589382 RepID=UPI00355BBDED